MDTPQLLQEGAQEFTFAEGRQLARNIYEAYTVQDGHLIFAMDALQEPKVFRGVMALAALVIHAIDTIEQIELVKEETEDAGSEE
jgi:hypothetical protein